MSNKANRKRVVSTMMVVVMALLLGVFTTTEYVRALGPFVEQGQTVRYEAVLEGHAGNPWQYRILAPYLLYLALGLFEQLHIPISMAVSFIIFRALQDMFVLLFSYEYYRKLGLSFSSSLVGMAILAWGMSYSHYDSDLQFSTFFDISFYLLAGIIILRGSFVWIIPITILAALNRETSGLIPFLLLSVAAFALPKGSLRKVIPIFVVAFVAYIAIFVGLRFLYGSQEPVIPYGHEPGLDLLQYNLLRGLTWYQLLATLSIVPIVALIGYRKWSIYLRAFFWTIVPIWFVIHALGSVMAETRLFLVPQAMVFIPGALMVLVHRAHTPDCASTPLQTSS